MLPAATLATTIGPRAVVLEPREVPLGGLRAMNVQRVLPQRALPTIGAWCFVDRFGPQVTTMSVDAHPHTGLQTVTWPLTGQVRHRDSLHSHVVLEPGALNLMTAGHGIAHTEYSVDHDSLLDALQLWVALPDHARDTPPQFESHPSLPAVHLPALTGADAVATVVMGAFAGVTSPATVFTPLVGAQVAVPAGSTVELPLEQDWEHGVLHLDGEVSLATDDGDSLPAPTHGALTYLGTQRVSVRVSATKDSRVFLLGGEPLAESLVMWWNFIGRSHEDIATARDEWEAQASRFGVVPESHGVRIPAPPLPQVRLTPRTRRLEHL